MNMGTMECMDARPLVPSYLDGEISEAQAGPLRRHLLACPSCRASAQAGKHMKRWFEPTAIVPVPRDFAARVARRAFAGTGSSDFEAEGAPTAIEEVLVAARAAERPAVAPAVAPAWAASDAEALTRPGEGRILRFVLQLTVAAAVLALLASVAIQGLRRPSSADLRADDRRTMTLDQALEKLDHIEDVERNAKPGAVGAERSR
jgi:anti-sigma factor RsiW